MLRAGGLAQLGADEPVFKNAGITPDDLRRWFKAMRAHGLTEVSGRIVLRKFALLHEGDPAQAAASAEWASANFGSAATAFCKTFRAAQSVQAQHNR